MQTKYHLYARFAGKTKFQPMHWGERKPVRDVYRATVFTEEQGRQALEESVKTDPCGTFELRPIEGTSLLRTHVIRAGVGA